MTFTGENKRKKLPMFLLILPSWKLFTKGITPSEAIDQIQMQGDEQLCNAVLGLVAVMA